MTTPIRTPAAEALEAAAGAVQEHADKWIAFRTQHDGEEYLRSEEIVLQEAVRLVRALAARIPPLPADVAGLVERLRSLTNYPGTATRLSADMLEAQSARIAALEAQVVCPIGLDSNPMVCSAGSCRACLIMRAETMSTMIDALEAQIAAADRLADAATDQLSALVDYMKNMGATDGAMYAEQSLEADAALRATLTAHLATKEPKP